MIDLASEKLISLRQAAKLFPPYREGKPTHVSRVFRAITKGKRCLNGNLVKLEGLVLGGQWVTSVEAIQRYAQGLTPSAQPALGVGVPVSRLRAIERAERALSDLGI